MPTTRFPRTARVRASSDFDRIFKHGRRVALPVLALHWQPVPCEASDVEPDARRLAQPDPAEPLCAPSADAAAVQSGVARAELARLGLAVSRKVDPHAVGRNRIKRVLRDSFRQHRAVLCGGDYVVVARVGAARCTGDELRQAFLSLLRRAGALPASAAPGTMPAAAPACTSPACSPSPDPASAPRVG